MSLSRLTNQQNGKSKAMSKGEHECKVVAESLFNKTFYKVRPDWLKNPYTGQNLEIDLYNDDLKLGIEYNGQQHYHYTKKFHRTYTEYVEQLKRDIIKKWLCDKHGVTLISVPYNVKNIQSHILSEISKIKVSQS